MLIDTHCHLEKKDYENLDELITKIFNSNVNKIIVSGYNIETNEDAIKLAEKYNNIYVSVGIGPSEVDKVKQQDWELLKKQIKHSKVVAIGEIGLDYYWTKENQEKQKEVLKKQLYLANKYNKPVVIHNREATNDIYKILKESNIKGIMHCFNGNLDYAQKFIKLGFLLGINGIITFKKNTELRQVIKSIPMKYIVLETDSPYLSPEPFRGQKNIPSNLTYIASTVAKIKGKSYETVEKITTNNVFQLFDLK
jgi:TatD DNase family protein